jgi:Sec-independent protein translocase protein TatA
MFALSRGEFVLVVFIFALVWGSGVLPRLGERLGARLAMRSVTRRGGGRNDSLNGG